MTKRTINIGVMTYRAAGMPDTAVTHGLLGEEVDVHPDDLKRFDANNQWVDHAPKYNPDADYGVAARGIQQVAEELKSDDKGDSGK